MKVSITRPKPIETETLKEYLSLCIYDSFKREGIADSHPNDLRYEIENNIKMLIHDFETNGAEEYFLTAKSDNKIIGFVGCGSLSTLIKDNSQFNHENCPEIKALYIHPDFQKQGIGSKLFESICSHLRETSAAEYCLDCGYTISQNFWLKKLGEPTVTKKDFYGPGAHYMIWHRQL